MCKGQHYYYKQDISGRRQYYCYKNACHACHLCVVFVTMYVLSLICRYSFITTLTAWKDFLGLNLHPLTFFFVWRHLRGENKVKNILLQHKPCAQVNVMNFTQFSPNCNRKSLVALYGSMMQVAWPQVKFPALQCCTVKRLLFSVQHC